MEAYPIAQEDRKYLSSSDKKSIYGAPFSHVGLTPTGEKRPPKKGEWFISGASPEVYHAPNDLSTPYVIGKKVLYKIVETVEILKEL